MNWAIALVVAVLCIGGALFSLTAAIGLNRLPDFYTRMHAASKAGTVGSGLLLLAVGLYSQELAVFGCAFVGFLFVVLTAPISAHLLAKSAHLAGYKLSFHAVKDDLEADRKSN